MHNTYFWADTHFNHRGIIGYCSRKYQSVHHMNLDLIQRWNSTVENETDEVWFLGDFGFYESNKHPDDQDLLTIFLTLRGTKHLVVGNHDERNPPVMKLPWDRKEKLVTFRLEGRRAELCHYPMESWKGSNGGSLHLHGHCHGTLERQIRRRFDVGVDVEPRPVEWREILARV